MTAEELLSRLDGVRARGEGAWQARCPAHHDESPSLSITEADGKTLLHCFAGCSVEAIVESLGLSLKDLFYESVSDPRQAAQAAKLRIQQRREREQRREAEGCTLDACKAAQRFIDSRHGLDISQWSDNQLNDELRALADAFALLDGEGL